MEKFIFYLVGVLGVIAIIAMVVLCGMFCHALFDMFQSWYYDICYWIKDIRHKHKQRQ